MLHSLRYFFILLLICFMKLLSKILLFACTAGMTCSAGVIEFHNCPMGWDEDGNSVLLFEDGVSKDNAVKATGISFGPRTDSSIEGEDESWTYPYDTTFTTDEEDADEPSMMVLERFTLLNVQLEGETSVGLWGIVVDSSGTVLATSARIDFSGSGPVTFDFSVDEPLLEMESVYTLTFVFTQTELEQLHIGVGDIFDDNGAALYVFSSVEVCDQLYDDEGQPITDENGDPVKDLENPFVYSANENLDYVYTEDAGERILLAPAVYIVGYTVAVPEPATAMLSLLALCGLAARRRRA